MLQAGCIGVFCALDLFLFFVMFEIVLVPMYFLIGGWGYAERVYAALKFFLFTCVDASASAVHARGPVRHRCRPTWSGASTCRQQQARHQRLEAKARRLPAPSSTSTSWRSRSRSTSRTPPPARARSTGAARWLFLAFAVAFAVKVPLFPLHTWLPDAHTQAPDGRLGDPGRRDAEARHLRLPALRPLPLPRRRRPGSRRRSSPSA